MKQSFSLSETVFQSFTPQRNSLSPRNETVLQSFTLQWNGLSPRIETVMSDVAFVLAKVFPFVKHWSQVTQLPVVFVVVVFVCF